MTEELGCMTTYLVFTWRQLQILFVPHAVHLQAGRAVPRARTAIGGTKRQLRRVFAAEAFLIAFELDESSLEGVLFESYTPQKNNLLKFDPLRSHGVRLLLTANEIRHNVLIGCTIQLSIMGSKHQFCEGIILLKSISSTNHLSP